MFDSPLASILTPVTNLLLVGGLYQLQASSALTQSARQECSTFTYASFIDSPEYCMR